MRVGRCLPDNYMLGCVADVSDLLKSRCDGKTSCTGSLPDREMHRRKQCRRDLVAYLEVDYQCVSGEMSNVPHDAHCCHMGTAIKHPVPDSSFAFLTSWHSDAQVWVSGCLDVKNYKWRLNPVSRKMLYRCTHNGNSGHQKVNVLVDVCVRPQRHSECGDAVWHFMITTTLNLHPDVEDRRFEATKHIKYLVKS